MPCSRNSCASEPSDPPTDHCPNCRRHRRTRDERTRSRSQSPTPSPAPSSILRGVPRLILEAQVLLIPPRDPMPGPEALTRDSGPWIVRGAAKELDDCVVKRSSGVVRFASQLRIVCSAEPNFSATSPCKTFQPGEERKCTPCSAPGQTVSSRYGPSGMRGLSHNHADRPRDGDADPHSEDHPHGHAHPDGHANRGAGPKAVPAADPDAVRWRATEGATSFHWRQSTTIVRSLDRLGRGDSRDGALTNPQEIGDEPGRP